MFELLNKIKAIGKNHCKNSEEFRHLSIINQLTLVSFLGHVCSFATSSFLGNLQDGLILLGFGILQLFSILLNYFGFRFLAAFYLVTFVNLMLFYFESHYGYESGTVLFYFPLLMGISTVFDLRKHKTQFFIHISFTVLLIITQFITKHSLFSSDAITVEFKKSMFAFNAITSAIVTSIMLFIVSLGNYRLKDDLELTIRQKTFAEESLNQNIKDKEVLLAEVHHRVKNNLAVITSLLNLKMGNVNNNYTRDVLLECRNRVMSMSLIHEKLYKSENISKVDFKKYIVDLVNEIRYSYPDKKNQIIFNTQCDDVLMDLGKAIPCGLLLNELITNSVKYAFLGADEKGNVVINVSRSGDRVLLNYSDNGKGFDVKSSKEKSDSLGMVLIESLTEQLDAIGGYEDNSGKKFSIRFSAN